MFVAIFYFRLQNYKKKMTYTNVYDIILIF